MSDAEINKDDEGVGKQRVQDLLTALNRLSTDLFAAISLAERQIAVLQDLYSVFSTSYRTKSGDSEKGHLLRQNPFHRNVVSIPVLSENPEEIWPKTLDTIDEVIRERKSFIKKVRGLVENMEVKRKIVIILIPQLTARNADDSTVFLILEVQSG